jgi:aromatic-L-amino-acid/L-tryptophan decarboxylase
MKYSRDNMVVFSSDQAHAIIKKACMVLGIGHHRVVPARKENNFALCPNDLKAAVLEEIALGRVPIVFVVTTGTTSSCAFDPVDAIGHLAKEFNVWMHVDAAYGGAYACLPELKPLFSGLDLADSIVVNCHKKLLCPFDLAAMYVADRGPLLQALSLQPEYLRNSASESGAVVDYEHWQLPLGRRFRALKLWFVFRRFGTTGLRKHLSRGLQLSAYFASLLAMDDEFELVVPVSLSLVCFRLRGRSDDDQRKFLQRVKDTGDCFIIHTKLADSVVLRFACGGIEQTEDDVLNAWKVIRREANNLDR